MAVAIPHVPFAPVAPVDVDVDATSDILLPTFIALPAAAAQDPIGPGPSCEPAGRGVVGAGALQRRLLPQPLQPTAPGRRRVGLCRGEQMASCGWLGQALGKMAATHITCAAPAPPWPRAWQQRALSFLHVAPRRCACKQGHSIVGPATPARLPTRGTELAPTASL